MKRTFSTTDDLVQWSPKRQTTLSDTRVRGLYIRGGPSGTKTFFRWVKTDGKPIRKIIGHWSPDGGPGTINLGTARARMAAIGEAKGIPGGGATVGDVLTSHGERLTERRERGDEVIAILRNHVAAWESPAKPRLGAFETWPLAAVASSDLFSLVEAVKKVRPRMTGTDAGAKPQARRGGVAVAKVVLREVRTMFATAARRYDMPNPAANLVAGDFFPKTKSRERHLAPDEMRALFAALKASPKMEEVTKLGIRFLCYVPVRTAALIGARWSEINWKASTWTIPVDRLKMHAADRKEAKPQVIHLPPQAVAILRRLETLAAGSPFVLASPRPRTKPDGTRIDAPIGDKALIHALADLQNRDGSRPGALNVEPAITVHDLRRTWRTWAGELGADFIAAERAMGHKTSGAGKVADTYLRGDAWDKQVEALNAVAEAIDDAVEGRPAKVTNINAAIK